MNQQMPSKNLPLFVFLFVGIACYCTNVGNAAPPKITPGELLIRMTPEASNDLRQLHAKSPIAALYTKHGVESLKPIFTFSAGIPQHNTNLQRTYLLRFSLTADLPTLKAAFEESDLIEAVAYNYLRPTLADKIVPNDPKYAEQWSLPLINLPQAWAIEKGNRDVIIAIIDSGIDYRHDDLTNKIWVNPGEIADNGLDDDGNGYIDDIHGWDFTDAPNLQAEGDFIVGDNEPLDESGHGTHVAGIAGATPNNSIGIAGVAWNCPLMAVRAGLSLGGESRMQDDDSAAAIVYAADNGASIINMSWGSAQHSFVIQDAIDYAYQRGAVLIGAAGNSNEAESIFPAGYRKVISVASTTQHKQRYYKSNFGASVDIGAPGNAILSTQIDNDYRILTGTSMAAPHVAGIAALIRSKRSNLTNEEVRQILTNTTDVILEKDSDKSDSKLAGAGTLNAERALLASGVLQARIHAPQTNSGGSTSITFIGTAGGYKFKSWQLFYGSSTIPTAYIPITESVSTQKVAEQLTVWDTTNILEDIYTVRLVVTGRDGNQTHDQVVLTVDRTPPKVFSVTANETLYGDSSSTIFTWATDDVTRNTFYFRRSGQIMPFASIEESGLAREHLFSLGLETGQYQFYIAAQNTVGLKTVDDNNGKYYTINVVGSSISPNGFVETELGMSPLHIANVSTDFDKDGSPELIGVPLTDTAEDGSTLPEGFVVYERSPTGKYNIAHNLSDIQSLAISSQGIDLETLIPWTIDDTDNDGLPEILANDKNKTFLIESITPNGYPTQIIWETPFISGGKIADLDNDGKKEIIGVDNNNNRILIFENRGNNAYHRTAAFVNETEGKNVFALDFAINDINIDGKDDLIVGDSEGELFIYTATGNNSFHLQWQTHLEIDGVRLLGSGDLTGDERSEFVVGGTISSPEVPSAAPIWKFLVFTYTSGKYVPLWEQAIAPYRLRGNSIAIAELDGDRQNELAIITQPNLYVIKWNGTTFVPTFHQKVAETPTLFTADLNKNGFHELYVNSELGLSTVESTFAMDINSVDTFTPWDVSATPLTAKVVQVTWKTAAETQAPTVFTIYRAIGEKSETPAETEFETIANNLTLSRFLDKTVEIDKTYWYAITAKGKTGIETKQSEAVSATPRLTPQIISAVYQPPNWIIVTFDRQMNFTISDERRYLLRQPKQLGGLRPMSAIRDRMGTRALLAFATDKLQPLIAVSKNQYEIAVSNVTDIDENPIRTAVTLVEIKHSVVETEVNDLTQLRVYPNPVRPNISDKGAVTFDKVPTGTHIRLFTPTGELLENLNVTESDGNSKEWWLTNGSIGDIATGIYIYILEFEAQQKVGKIAIIK